MRAIINGQLAQVGWGLVAVLCMGGHGQIRRSAAGDSVENVFAHAKSAVGCVCQNPVCGSYAHLQWHHFSVHGRAVQKPSICDMEARVADMVQRKGGRVPK